VTPGNLPEAKDVYPDKKYSREEISVAISQLMDNLFDSGVISDYASVDAAFSENIIVAVKHRKDTPFFAYTINL